MVHRQANSTVCKTTLERHSRCNHAISVDSPLRDGIHHPLRRPGVDSILHFLLLDVRECLFHPSRVLARDRKIREGRVVGEFGHCDAAPACLAGSPRGRDHVFDVNPARQLIVEELVFLGAPAGPGGHGTLWGGGGRCVRYAGATRSLVLI